MRNTFKVLASVVGAATMLVLGGAAPASAVNVGTQAAPTGPPSSISVSGSVPSVRLVQSNMVQVNCAAMSAGVTVNTGTFSVLPATIGTLQPGFSSCSGPLGLAVSIVCSGPADVDIVGPPVGTWFALTPVQISGISCFASVPAISPPCNATLSGSLAGELRNPLGATAGLLVLDGSTGLALSGSTCPTIIADGPATLGPAGSSLPLVFNWTGSGVDHPFIS